MQTQINTDVKSHNEMPFPLLFQEVADLPYLDEPEGYYDEKLDVWVSSSIESGTKTFSDVTICLKAVPDDWETSED